MPLTSGTPLNVLVDRLARAGWGDLARPEVRGLGRVLAELARVLPPRSGAGKVTAPQLAAQCGYTERWVRRCLTLLEELEVIEWNRGGIVAGQPTPSWVRVSKAAVVDLIHLARHQQGERLQEQARQTRARVARLRTSYTRRPAKGRKKPPSRSAAPHAELVTALLFSKEVPAVHGPPGSRTKDQNDDAPASAASAQSALARMRADLAAIRRLPHRRRAPGRGQLGDDPAPPAASPHM